MAIITHPDGYLQITEGYNWQDVSDNGILQRIFRGWNERRLVAGLPLYWYGKNPNASELLGGDAQFTEFENPLLVPNPIHTIEDARIYPGANLQNVAFWRKLQDLEIYFASNYNIDFGKVFFPLFKNGYNYDDVVFYIDAFLPAFFNFIDIYAYTAKVGDLSYLRDNARLYADSTTRESLFSRYTSEQNQTTGYIEQGDIIGAHTINDILKVFYEFQNVIVPVDYDSITRFANSTSSEEITSCEQAINLASNEWVNNPGSTSGGSSVQDSPFLSKFGQGQAQQVRENDYSSDMQGDYVDNEKWKIKYFEKVNNATWVLNSSIQFFDPNAYVNPFPSNPEGKVKTLTFIPQSEEVSHNSETTNNQPLTAAPDVFAGGWDGCNRHFDYLVMISLFANYRFADLPEPTP